MLLLVRQVFVSYIISVIHTILQFFEYYVFQQLQQDMSKVHTFKRDNYDYALRNLLITWLHVIGVARILSAGVHFFYHPAKTPKN